MFGISLARISLLTGTSLGGGVGVSPTLDLNFRGQGYSAAMAGYTFNQLIDFTRTSSATYVDATGKIVSTPASRNLLTFTQEFGNAAWVTATGTATLSANSATAPDGTLTAGTLAATSANAIRWQTYIPTVGVSYTFSIWLRRKSGTGNVQITADGSTFTTVSVGDAWTRFSASYFGALVGTKGAGVRIVTSGDEVYLWGAQLEAVPDANLVLGSEVVTVNSATLTGATGYTAITGSAVVAGAAYLVTYTCTLSAGTIQAVVGGTALTSVSTSGTYRAIVTAGATTAPQFYSLGGVGSISNFSVKQITGTTGMPTDYTRNVGGVFPPRFDYDPVTLAPRGLLVEEQRTNLLLRSEEFDNSIWIKSDATVTANAVLSPDGTVDADFLVEGTSAATTHGFYRSATLTAGSHTLSIYAKAGTRSWLWLVCTAAANAGAYFDLATGTVGAVSSGYSASIAPAGNGWYRCSITFTATAASWFPNVFLATGNNGAVYTGDGTSGIYIWGAQLEAGAFATSYIPTVASQVTRTADVATITGANFSQWYNQSEGTFVVEGSVYSTGISGNRKSLLAATEGNFNNSVLVSVLSGTTASGGIRSGGVQQADTSVASAISANTVFKMAFAVKADNFALCVNGGAVVTDTSGAMLSNATLLDIGYGPQNSAGLTNTAGDYLNSHIRSIKYFPTRLSNTQLQALTV